MPRLIINFLAALVSDTLIATLFCRDIPEFSWRIIPSIGNYFLSQMPKYKIYSLLMFHTFFHVFFLYMKHYILTLVSLHPAFICL